MIVNKYYKVIRVLKDGGDGPTPFYIENISGEDGVFFTGSTSTSYTKRNLLYKIDNGEWFEYSDDGTKIDVPNGSRIYLMGDNSVFSNRSEYYQLSLTKKTSTSSFINCNIGGYLTSLLQTTDFDKVDTIPDSAFYRLFMRQRIVSAKDLITNNIKNVGVSAFEECFRYCTSLTTLPEGMFSGVTSAGSSTFSSCFASCKSLTTLPEGMFSGVTSAGSSTFSSCFYDCTSLTTLPEGMFSGVTNVQYGSFYSCFYGCTSLTTLPEGMFSGVTSAGSSTFSSCFASCKSLTTLPEGMFSSITSVNSGGYPFKSCFANCTSLTTLPEGMFSSITSVSGETFKYCFQNCSSLLVGPNFKNITGSTSHDAFDNCFEGCSNLQLIYAPSMSAWNESYFQDWVKGVYPTGKMYVKIGVVPPTGTSGVPEGWQLLNY